MHTLAKLTAMALLLTTPWSTLAAADSAAPAAPPIFTSKPTATKTPDGVRIDFAVSKPTDVAVYIEDGGAGGQPGKVVCHLVAGVIGSAKTPPPPLKANSLEQSIPWDGKDDAGLTAAGGPFKVRVTLGMSPKFDRFVMDNPEACGRVCALAVGPGGNVYVFHLDNTANDNMAGPKLKLYSREGKRLKVLMPFPADIAADKLKALDVFKTAEGDLVPHLYNWEHLSFYPDTVGGRGRDMPEGAELPAVDSKGRVYWMVHGPSLGAIDADGGTPYDTFIGPKMLGEIKGLKMAGEGPWEYWAEKPSLTVSSDDKFVYFAGLSKTLTAPQQAEVKKLEERLKIAADPEDKAKLQRELDELKAGALPCVFRVSAETRGPAEEFLGSTTQPGTEKKLLTAPRGMAVVKGLIYVADAGADRIAVFKEADRSFVGEIKVASPQCVGVDPATGAVYVCSYGQTAARRPKGSTQPADAKAAPVQPQGPQLLKFDSLAAGKELYRIALPGSSVPGQTRIAVDASAKPVRIWVPETMYAPWSIKCIDDAGDKFVDTGDPLSKDPWIPGPRDLSLDRSRGELYIKGNFGKMSRQKYWRLDEKTCKVLKDFDAQIVSSGIQMVPGTDEALYTMCFDSGLFRLDRDFKPLNFEGQKSNHIHAGGVMNFQLRNLALRPFAPVDELFVVVPPFSRLMLEEKLSYDDAAKKAQQYMNARYTSLNVLGQDGKTRRTAIWQCLDSAVPRLDRWGNIYLVDAVKPVDRSYPEFFDGKLPEPGSKDAARRSDVLWNNAMYASIIKFPPTGGAIWFAQAKGKRALSCLGDPPADLLAKPKVPFKTQYNSGMAGPTTGEVQGADWIRFGYSPFSMPGSGGMCNCEGNGFDVDPFGRVFYPNMGQFRVEVIDTNNNPITTFGKYGNEDSGGKDAKVTRPEIPFAWPVYVVASDTHAYVADTVNRRVVRVKLDCLAEERCVIGQ